jgi:hypothetical protein
MLTVGFKPITIAFVRKKTFHALDRAATVKGLISDYIISYKKKQHLAT